MRLKKLVTSFLVGASLLAVAGCSSSKNYTLPSEDSFQGYRIIDGVDKDTVFVKVNANEREKIAVVVRDIATTAYSFLEPRYMNSIVNYDGKSKCCAAAPGLMGNTGLMVYKFSFIGKGETSIQLVARHKGLSATASLFDTDHVFTINVTAQ